MLLANAWLNNMYSSVPADLDISVVIPVFNSERIIEATVAELIEVLEDANLSYEIVLVNDGSADGSWIRLENLAKSHSEITAIDLLRNYGQHQANLVGFRHARGRWIVTMDDDGQNPPVEIPRMLEAARSADSDLVFGRFLSKQAGRVRTLGSNLMDHVNSVIFGRPSDLHISNFRVIRRDVVDRIVADRNSHPYVTGQALMYSSAPINVDVEHRPRAEGQSTYSKRKLARLVGGIFFSFSAVPVQLVGILGGLVSILAIAVAIGSIGVAVVSDRATPGWASVVILLAVFNVVVVAMLTMIASLQIRMYRQLSGTAAVHVREIKE